MIISEKLQKRNFTDVSRGFQGHSISDKQKRPYREGKRLNPQVSLYSLINTRQKAGNKVQTSARLQESKE